MKSMIMSAAAAYDKTKDELDVLCVKEFDELEKVIIEACERGEFQAEFYKDEYYNAICDLEEALEDAGYEYKTHMMYDEFDNCTGYYISIYWGMKYIDEEVTK